MKEAIDTNLSNIISIWNDFIWDFKFCQSKIKFDEDSQSNYFGDIMRYFNDTFDMLYQREQKETFSENFKDSIYLLQIIYIHQDFIEELLRIFKTNIQKDTLKKNVNYSINRDIRNELIGHPIRKKNIDGKNRLLSSTIFSNDLSYDKLCYIRYHKNDNFSGQQLEFKFEEIITRHEAFLLEYTNIILQRLKIILRSFKKKIINIINTYKKIEFHSLIKFLEHTFENIFESNYPFEPNALAIIYNRKDENFRYQNIINLFFFKLNIQLQETRISINKFLNEELDEDKNYNNLSNYDKIKNIDLGEREKVKSFDKLKQSYTYALGKLLNKNKRKDFYFFSDIIREENKSDSRIIGELNHMEQNLENDLEYYSACLYIRRLLIIENEK